MFDKFLKLLCLPRNRHTKNCPISRVNHDLEDRTGKNEVDIQKKNSSRTKSNEPRDNKKISPVTLKAPAESQMQENNTTFQNIGKSVEFDMTKNVTFNIRTNPIPREHRTSKELTNEPLNLSISPPICPKDGPHAPIKAETPNTREWLLNLIIEQQEMICQMNRIGNRITIKGKKNNLVQTVVNDDQWVKKKHLKQNQLGFGNYSNEYRFPLISNEFGDDDSNNLMNSLKDKILNIRISQPGNDFSNIHSTGFPPILQLFPTNLLLHHIFPLLSTRNQVNHQLTSYLLGTQRRFLVMMLINLMEKQLMKEIEKGKPRKRRKYGREIEFFRRKSSDHVVRESLNREEDIHVTGSNRSTKKTHSKKTGFISQSSKNKSGGENSLETSSQGIRIIKNNKNMSLNRYGSSNRNKIQSINTQNMCSDTSLSARFPCTPSNSIHTACMNLKKMNQNIPNDPSTSIIPSKCWSIQNILNLIYSLTHFEDIYTIDMLCHFQGIIEMMAEKDVRAVLICMRYLAQNIWGMKYQKPRHLGKYEPDKSYSMWNKDIIPNNNILDDEDLKPHSILNRECRTKTNISDKENTRFWSISDKKDKTPSNVPSSLSEKEYMKNIKRNSKLNIVSEHSYQELNDDKEPPIGYKKNTYPLDISNTLSQYNQEPSQTSTGHISNRSIHKNESPGYISNRSIHKNVSPGYIFNRAIHKNEMDETKTGSAIQQKNQWIGIIDEGEEWEYKDNGNISKLQSDKSNDSNEVKSLNGASGSNKVDVLIGRSSRSLNGSNNLDYEKSVNSYRHFLGTYDGYTPRLLNNADNFNANIINPLNTDYKSSLISLLLSHQSHTLLRESSLLVLSLLPLDQLFPLLSFNRKESKINLYHLLTTQLTITEKEAMLRIIRKYTECWDNIEMECIMVKYHNRESMGPPVKVNSSKDVNISNYVNEPVEMNSYRGEITSGDPLNIQNVWNTGDCHINLAIEETDRQNIGNIDHKGNITRNYQRKSTTTNSTNTHKYKKVNSAGTDTGYFTNIDMNSNGISNNINIGTNVFDISSTNVNKSNKVSGIGTYQSYNTNTSDSYSTIQSTCTIPLYIKKFLLNCLKDTPSLTLLSAYILIRLPIYREMIKERLMVIMMQYEGNGNRSYGGSGIKESIGVNENRPREHENNSTTTITDTNKKVTYRRTPEVINTKDNGFGTSQVNCYTPIQSSTNQPFCSNPTSNSKNQPFNANKKNCTTETTNTTSTIQGNTVITTCYCPISDILLFLLEHFTVFIRIYNNDCIRVCKLKIKIMCKYLGEYASKEDKNLISNRETNLKKGNTNNIIVNCSSSEGFSFKRVNSSDPLSVSSAGDLKNANNSKEVNSSYPPKMPAQYLMVHNELLRWSFTDYSFCVKDLIQEIAKNNSNLLGYTLYSVINRCISRCDSASRSKVDIYTTSQSSSTSNMTDTAINITTITNIIHTLYIAISDQIEDFKDSLVIKEVIEWVIRDIIHFMGNITGTNQPSSSEVVSIINTQNNIDSSRTGKRNSSNAISSLINHSNCTSNNPDYNLLDVKKTYEIANDTTSGISAYYHVLSDLLRICHLLSHINIPLLDTCHSLIPHSTLLAYELSAYIIRMGLIHNLENRWRDGWPKELIHRMRAIRQRNLKSLTEEGIMAGDEGPPDISRPLKSISLRDSIQNGSLGVISSVEVAEQPVIVTSPPIVTSPQEVTSPLKLTIPLKVFSQEEATSPPKLTSQEEVTILNNQGKASPNTTNIEYKAIYDPVVNKKKNSSSIPTLDSFTIDDNPIRSSTSSLEVGPSSSDNLLKTNNSITSTNINAHTPIPLCLDNIFDKKLLETLRKDCVDKEGSGTDNPSERINIWQRDNHHDPRSIDKRDNHTNILDTKLEHSERIIIKTFHLRDCTCTVYFDKRGHLYGPVCLMIKKSKLGIKNRIRTNTANIDDKSTKMHVDGLNDNSVRAHVDNPNNNTAKMYIGDPNNNNAAKMHIDNLNNNTSKTSLVHSTSGNSTGTDTSNKITSTTTDTVTLTYQKTTHKISIPCTVPLPLCPLQTQTKLVRFSVNNKEQTVRIPLCLTGQGIEKEQWQKQWDMLVEGEMVQKIRGQQEGRLMVQIGMCGGKCNRKGGRRVKENDLYARVKPSKKNPSVFGSMKFKEDVSGVFDLRELKNYHTEAFDLKELKKMKEKSSNVIGSVESHLNNPKEPMCINKCKSNHSGKNSGHKTSVFQSETLFSTIFTSNNDPPFCPAIYHYFYGYHTGQQWFLKGKNRKILKMIKHDGVE